MKRKPFADKKVKTVFDQYPKNLRTKLDRMRQLIFEVANETEGVGPLDETLKWGSPGYLTNESQSGTTVRIDRISWQKEKYGIFVHCQSGVMEQFKSAFGNAYDYDGKRGIILDTKDDIPEEAVRHFIWLALTYHLRKKRKPRGLI
ncbi:MAG TPA: DUF1801 domain-containing protein [Cyclobacteriaceae bacterium]|nr:DUF1801 domain-containing protein [Cyclobacteriaceae bacterium]